jgi:uncharacterized RDD family membrane protein YckC
MGCPQCESDEISPSGICLVCGYNSSKDALLNANDTGDAYDKSAAVSSAIEIDYSGSAQEPQRQSELPDWRRELSERLSAIKQRKEAETIAFKSAPAPSTPAPDSARKEAAALQANLLKQVAARKTRVAAPKVVPKQITLKPLEQEAAFEKPQRKPVEQMEIQNLINKAIDKQRASVVDRVDFTPPSLHKPKEPSNSEGKFLLLSRTLSGMVDLIIISACTGLMIIAADRYSGIIALDRASVILIVALFLLNYFVYSLFFLAASSQTLGMMMTDLRVVGINNKRPSIPRILARCAVFLCSLFGLGIGLISAFFERESQCFHDKRSGTRVVRI